MPIFRMKGSVVEARQFETNNEPGDRNMNALAIWINQGRAADDGLHAWHNGTSIFIQAPEGTTQADVGDWIIKGARDAFYSCKPDIFAADYESAPG